MKNHKITVTVGISAYNESQNIISLVDSILTQTRKSYVLEKIIVLSDGSTDGTEKILNDTYDNNRKISIITDGLRMGKNNRICQILKINTSDIVIFMDADTIPANGKVLESLIKKFNTETTVLVSGNIQPVNPVTFVEHLIFHWTDIWYKIKKNANSGDTIHNANSAFFAIRKDFGSLWIIPNSIVSCGHFFYCAVKNYELDFKYCDEAVSYHKLPETIHDYILQQKRSPFDRKELIGYFDPTIHRHYRIPSVTIIRNIFAYIIRNPFMTLCSFLFNIFIKFAPSRNYMESNNGIWPVIRSTKKKLII